MMFAGIEIDKLRASEIVGNILALLGEKECAVEYVRC